MATRKQLRGQKVQGMQSGFGQFWIIIPLAHEATLRTNWARFNTSERGRMREALGILMKNKTLTRGATGTSRLTRAECEEVVRGIPRASVLDYWPPKNWIGES